MYFTMWSHNLSILPFIGTVVMLFGRHVIILNWAHTQSKPAREKMCSPVWQSSHQINHRAWHQTPEKRSGMLDIVVFQWCWCDDLEQNSHAFIERVNISLMLWKQTRKCVSLVTRNVGFRNVFIRSFASGLKIETASVCWWITSSRLEYNDSL